MARMMRNVLVSFSGGVLFAVLDGLLNANPLALQAPRVLAAGE